MKGQVVCVAGRKAFAPGLHTKGVGNGGFRQDVMRRAIPKAAPAFQKQHVVTDIGRKVQIMQGHDANRIARGHRRFDASQNGQLMM